MKIHSDHLLRFIKSKPSLDEISKNLFQLGHEHDLIEGIFDFEFESFWPLQPMRRPSAPRNLEQLKRCEELLSNTSAPNICLIMIDLDTNLVPWIV